MISNHNKIISNKNVMYYINNKKNQTTNNKLNSKNEMREGDRVILLLLVGKNINYDPRNVSLRGVKVLCNETLRGVLVPAMKHCGED